MNSSIFFSKMYGGWTISIVRNEIGLIQLISQYWKSLHNSTIRNLLETDGLFLKKMTEYETSLRDLTKTPFVELKRTDLIDEIKRIQHKLDREFDSRISLPTTLLNSARMEDLSIFVTSLRHLLGVHHNSVRIENQNTIGVPNIGANQNSVTAERNETTNRIHTDSIVRPSPSATIPGLNRRDPFDVPPARPMYNRTRIFKRPARPSEFNVVETIRNQLRIDGIIAEILSNPFVEQHRIYNNRHTLLAPKVCQAFEDNFGDFYEGIPTNYEDDFYTSSSDEYSEEPPSQKRRVSTLQSKFELCTDIPASECGICLDLPKLDKDNLRFSCCKQFIHSQFV